MKHKVSIANLNLWILELIKELVLGPDQLNILGHRAQGPN